MPISLLQSNRSCFVMVCVLFLVPALLALSGDVHPNPGPNTNDSQSSVSTPHSESSITSSDSHKSQNKHLTMVHCNVQSLCINDENKNKMDLVRHEFMDCDIICITESHLPPNIDMDKIKIRGFREPFINSRNAHGGGILVYVANTIHADRLDQYELNVECIWLKIRHGNTSFLLGTFYRQPSRNVDYWDEIDTSISMATTSGTPNIVITGDLNDDQLKPGGKLRNILNTHNMHQFISEPTRVTENSKSCLDIIASNNKNIIKDTWVVPPALGDHHSVFCSFDHKKQKQKTFQREIWLYDKADYEGLNNALDAVDWDNELLGDTLDESCSKWLEKYLNIIGAYIPHKKVTIRPSDLPWRTNEIRRKSRKRDRLHRKAKQTNMPDHWSHFRKARNEVISLLRSEKNKYFGTLASKLKSGSLQVKNWWQVAKKFIKKDDKEAGLPCLYDSDSDKIISESQEKADLFNDFFVEQSTADESHNQDPPEIPAMTSNILRNIVLTEKDVHDVITNLKTNKASGPDLVSPKVLKHTARSISKPLTALFNKSLSEAKFPSEWKIANVTPIFKKDSPHAVNNYRPISLLSCLGKILERCVFNKVFNFFRDNKVIYMYQAAYQPGDSTTNQLVELYDTILKAMDDHKEVRFTFLDMSKAFDRVWHKGLLAKLKACGINGTLHAWFSDYLSNRKQQVVCEGSHSKLKPITAGVPQGSILGPLLFLVYINDLPRNIDSQVRIFADDTTLFLETTDPFSCANTINRDLKKVSEWAKTWKMIFNPSKTETVTFTRLLNHQPDLNFDDVMLSDISNHKHLGLTLSSNGKWNEHINSIVVKAAKRLGLLKSVSYILDRATLEKLYFSFIRPILEYGDIVWCNLTDTLANKLELIHIEAGRIVSGCTKSASKEVILKELGWKKLLTRRKEHRMAYMYRVRHNMLPSYICNLFPDTRQNDVLRHNLRTANNFSVNHCNTLTYLSSLIPRATREWNSLEQEAKQSCSLAALKQYFKKLVKPPPIYYHTGNRRAQIYHTRLRTGCSSLHSDLKKNHIQDHTECTCGSPVENAAHYLLHCRLFDDIRKSTIGKLPVGYQKVNILLRGNENLPDSENQTVFTAVQEFIEQTGRFH